MGLKRAEKEEKKGRSSVEQKATSTAQVHFVTEEKSFRILVVDDTAPIRGLLKKYLTKLGYEVLVASCPSEALKLVTCNTFHLIMMDLRMPEMNGLELARILWEENENLEIIVMTGHGSIESASKALRMGACDYMLKPFQSLEMVQSSVRRIAEKRKLQNERDLFVKRLDASQASFSSIVEKSGDGILVVNGNGIIRYANPVAEHFFRELSGVLVGQSFPYPFKLGACVEISIDSKQMGPFDADLVAVSTDWEGESASLITIRDLTEKKLTEKALQKSEERYELVAQGAYDGLWDWDLSERKIEYAPRWKGMLGYEADELKNNLDTWLSRVHVDDRQILQHKIDACLAGVTLYLEGEFRLLHRNGSYLWVLCRGIIRRDATGKPTRLAGSISDITKRRSIEAKLLHSAFHDLLTGLPNRALFYDRLSQALFRMERPKAKGFSVLLLDLDHFKVVNDGLGFQLGDQLLIAFSKRLRRCVRTNDTIARLGGDEFVILLEESEDAITGIQAAQRIKDSLKEPFRLKGFDVFTTASIGIVLGSASYLTAEEVMRDADTAMYQAKLQGRSGHEVFDREMHRSAFARLQLEVDLRKALKKEEFHLSYQPLFDLKNNKITGFEALLRWNHPKRGNIGPSEFIPVAEENGLIIPIGSWVLKEACRQLLEWQIALPEARKLTIGVNVSVRQFSQPDFAKQLSLVLEETGLQASCLKLEITESAIIDNSDLAKELFEKIQLLGVQLHMDDFGTGYSSLSYLHRFPIDTLKIDRSFVGQMSAECGRTAIVKTIINLAENLKMNVIAEGIENQEQLELLYELGCSFGQGFFLGRPMIAEDAHLFLKERLYGAKEPPCLIDQGQVDV